MDSAGNIAAVGTRTHTDESPFKVKGWMRSWNVDYVATDNKRYRTEYREIVFPLRPHYEFSGFITSATHRL